MAKLAPAPAMSIGARIYSQFKLANHMKPMINTVVTNVPGPPVPIYSSGAKLIGLYGKLCLVDGIKLGHVVHSYVDDVTVSFTACRTAIPDPDFYAQCLQDSFDAHMDALPKKDKTVSKATTKTASKTITSPERKTVKKAVKANGAKRSAKATTESP